MSTLKNWIFNSLKFKKIKKMDALMNNKMKIEHSIVKF